jgi:hypothetical protein
MTLNNVVCKVSPVSYEVSCIREKKHTKDHHQDENTKPNCKIDQDCTTLVYFKFGGGDHTNACDTVIWKA